MNQGRNANNKEVVEEQKREADPDYAKKKADKQEHHHNPDTIPTVDVRYVDDHHCDDVVQNHLHEILALWLQEDRNDSLEIPCDIQNVVAAHVRPHDFMASLCKALPPLC